MVDTVMLPTIDQRPVLRIVRPFVRFAQLESSSSLLLLGATLAALLLANTSLNHFYQQALNVRVGFTVRDLHFAWPLNKWINDVLMGIFFLVVGLEVKREFLKGELASFRRAILPVLAALGGMIAPALVYLAFNHGTPNQKGWGIPVATDIAFSLAILISLGKRVPLALRIFLASLAIADDIGGVLVIAIAYTSKLHFGWLIGAAAVFLAGLFLNRLGVARLSIYIGLGLLLWIALYASGLHPTLAGIALALIVPSRTFLHPEGFIEHGHKRLEQFRVAHRGRVHSQASEHLNRLDTGIALVQSPLDRMEVLFHPWVSYGIMPVFALANAGIPLQGIHLASTLKPAFLGTALGLLLGKPLGITLFSWLAVRLHIAELPKGVSWLQLHAASWVAGIGFTVAIFIASLAFANEASYTQSRLAIVVGSACAAAIGAALLKFSSVRPNPCESDPVSAGKQN